METLPIQETQSMKNTGIDIAREIAERSEKDWVFGALSPLSLVSIPESEREMWLPVGELQYGVEDFQDCATRSGINAWEALFSYGVAKQLLHIDNIRWLSNNGYVEDGRVTFSDRFVAINSGTTRQGNSLKAPLEAARTQGLIPKKMLPRDPSFTWDQYHDKTKITQEMRDLGAEFARRFTLNYEQVYEMHISEALKDDFIDVASYAWPSPINGVYPRTEAQPNHAYALIKNKYVAFDNYIDSYDGDFKKNLAPDYDFWDYAYRIFISKEDPNATAKQISLYQQLVALLIRYRDLLLKK